MVYVFRKYIRSYYIIKDPKHLLERTNSSNQRRIKLLTSSDTNQLHRKTTSFEGNNVPIVAGSGTLFMPPETL